MVYTETTPIGDDDARLTKIIDDLRSFQHDMVERANRETIRANAAEEQLRELAAELDNALARAASEADEIRRVAHREADEILATARAQAAAEHDQVLGRERVFVEALRSYLTDIDEAQTTLLRVARRALSIGAAEDAASPDGSSNGRVVGPEGQAASALPAPTVALTPPTSPTQSAWAPPSPWALPAAEKPADPGVRSGSPAVAAPTSFVTGAPQNGGSAAAWPPPTADRSADRVTDEHRIIDLHNRLDMERIQSNSAGSPRRLFGLRPRIAR